VLRDPDGGLNWVRQSSGRAPQFHRLFAEATGLDYIDIYRPARLDPAVPNEDTVGAIADLVKAGYVRHIALSEISIDAMRSAATVHPIVDLQIDMFEDDSRESFRRPVAPWCCGHRLWRTRSWSSGRTPQT